MRCRILHKHPLSRPTPQLELGSWLLHCLESEDEKEIAIAENMVSELRDQLESGNLRNLRAASFAGIAYQAVDEKDSLTEVAANPADPADPADQVETIALETAAEEDTDSKNDDELF